MTPTLWMWAADGVLILHCCVVLFVVGGLISIILGNLKLTLIDQTFLNGDRTKWRVVNRLWFRLLHLFAIGVVVLESWFGVDCPLTTLEISLRRLAGEASYSTSFIEHWLGQLLYHDLPQWLFTTAYTVFGSLVVFVWWWFPPQRAPQRKSGGR